MPGNTGGPFGDYMNKWFEEWGRFFTTAGEGWASQNVPTSSPSENSREGTDNNRDFVNLMLRVSLAFSNSGLRYWEKWLKIYMSYFPVISHNLSLLNSDPNGNNEAKGTLVDNFRACLREMAEIPGQESRLLQAEFERIIRDALDAEEESQGENYRRQWRAKQ